MIYDLLHKHGACDEALAWVREREGSTVQELWNTCPRPDWLAWIVGKALPGDRRLVLWAADCAERVLPIYEAYAPGDDRPRRAIEAARSGHPNTAAYAAAAERTWQCHAFRKRFTCDEVLKGLETVCAEQ